MNVDLNTKPSRHNFVFPAEIENLLRKIEKETELSLTTIIKQGIKLLAEKKGVSND